MATSFSKWGGVPYIRGGGSACRRRPLLPSDRGAGPVTGLCSKGRAGSLLPGWLPPSAFSRRRRGPPDAAEPAGRLGGGRRRPPSGDSTRPAGGRLAWSEENRSNAAWAPTPRTTGHDVGEQTQRSPGAEERPRASRALARLLLPARPRTRAPDSSSPPALTVPSTALSDEFPPPAPSTPGNQSPGRAQTNQSHAKSRNQATNPGARHGNSAPNGSLAMSLDPR